MKKTVGIILLLQGILLGMPLKTYAATESNGGALRDTQLVKGTLALLRDATVVALVLEAVLCGLLVIKEFIMMQQADDQDKPRHKKNIKITIISGIIIMCVTGLLTAIFSYYL